MKKDFDNQFKDFDKQAKRASRNFAGLGCLMMIGSAIITVVTLGALAYFGIWTLRHFGLV